MNLLQFVVIKLTIFLVVGILFGYYINPPLFISLVIVLLALIILAIIHFGKSSRPGPAYGFWAMVGTVGLGMLSVNLNSSFTYKELLADDHLKSAHLWELSIRDKLKSTDFYHRFIMRVESLDNIKVEGLLLCKVAVKDSIDHMSTDDKIKVWATIQEIAPPLNPHQFDYKKYMADMGIHHQVQLYPYNHLKTGHIITLHGLVSQIRYNISSRLQALDFGTDELSIIRALLLGLRDNIDKDTYNNYKKAGAIHILAVSGLHVGIVLLILEFLLKPLTQLPRGRLLKLITTIILLWSFALLAGFSASVIRAVSMFSFLAYALYLNRPGSTFNILALSMSFILLAIDPLLLFQVGFQLSYAAVISIVWVYPKMQKIWNPKHLIVRKCWQLFSVGLAAQAGVLPISLFYFHQFPSLFFITNMAIVPFLGLILGMGFLIVILVLFNAVPSFLSQLYNHVISTMNLLVDWIAKKENFLLQDIYFDQMHLLLTCFLLIALVQVLDRFKASRIMLLCSIFICIQIWNICIESQTKEIEKLTLFHTVGETVLLYQNGTHATVMADSGENSVRLTKSLKIRERFNSISYEPLKNIYHVKGKKLVILDQPVLLYYQSTKPDLLILSGSPNINLDRYLSAYQPQKIVVDGSNYRNYIRRWQSSCDNFGIPLYDTAKEGALVLTLE